MPDELRDSHDDDHGPDVPVEWLEVLDGRAHAEDVAEQMLRRGDDPEQVARDQALFRPVPARLRMMIVDDLCTRFAESESESESGSDDVVSPSKPDEATDPSPSETVRRPWWRRAELAAVAVAAAAALVLTLWAVGGSRTPSEAGEGFTELGATYVVQLEGSQRRMRSPAAERIERFEADGVLRIVASPEQTVDGAVEAALFAYREGSARRLDVAVTHGEGGALQLEGAVAEVLGLSPGRWSLAVAVGRPGSLDHEPERYRSGSTTVLDQVQVTYFEIEVQGATLLVELAGCEVRRTERCVIAPGRPLFVWIDGPRAMDATIMIDGETVPATPYTVAGEVGSGVRVDPPTAGGQLQISLPDRLGFDPWSAEITAEAQCTSPAQQRWLARLDTLREQAGQAQQAGRWAKAVELRRIAMDEALRRGFLSRGLEVGVAAAYVQARFLDDLDGARALLDELASVASLYPQGQTKLSYYRGVVAMTEGRVDESVDAFEHATRGSFRLHDEGLAAAAVPMFAIQLIEIGRYRQAAVWSQVALHQSDEPCALALNAKNAGWAALLLGVVQEQGVGGDLRDPIELLERSYELYQGECGDPQLAMSTRVSLAVAAAQQQQWSQAQTWLQGVESDSLTSTERLWAADVTVSVALATGGSDLDAALARLEAAAQESVELGARWRVALRRGEVMQAAGNMEAAVGAYREAEAELDGLVSVAELGLGRELFAAQRSASARRLVDVLLELGRVDQAQCAARLSRLRGMAPAWSRNRAEDPARRAALDDLRAQYRAAWRALASADNALAPRSSREAETTALREQLDVLVRELAGALDESEGPGVPHTCAELARPQPDELLLVLFPLDAQLAVMAVDARRSTAHRLPHAQGTAQLLEQLGPRIEPAERVKVVAAGRAVEVDVHALSLAGEPLVQRVPVVYSADLAPSTAAPSPTPHPPRAVLVEDAGGSLGAPVRAEIDHVSRTLKSSGWSATRLTAAELTRDHGLEQLGGVELFHYAGHASSGEPWTRDDGPSVQVDARGWSGRLELGRSGGLDISQVLLLPRVPETVVLMACSTGTVDAQASSGGMSLALAFLLAGSESVIATTDPIDNVAAAEITRSLYRRERGTGFDAALGLRRAQVAAQYTMPSQTWAKLRVWVR